MIHSCFECCNPRSHCHRLCCSWPSDGRQANLWHSSCTSSGSALCTDRRWIRKECRSSTNYGCATAQPAAKDRHRYSPEDRLHVNRNVMNAYADQALLTLNLKVFFTFRPPWPDQFSSSHASDIRSSQPFDSDLLSRWSVGYQGDRLQKPPHLQPARSGSRRMVGLLKLPARCAGPLSSQITQSQRVIKAAMCSRRTSWDTSFWHETKRSAKRQ